MGLYWIGMLLGFVSGFWAGRAFEYWLIHFQSHTPCRDDRE